MPASLTRLILIYLLLLFSVRLMGRRQIGELQPTELVITILLSEIAATPIVNADAPLLPSVFAVLTLSALEILLSGICLHADPLRRLLQGKPIPVIRDGKPVESALRELRVSVDDLLEGLREKDVFETDHVSLAILEANGKLSIQLQPSYLPVLPEDLQKTKPDEGVVLPLICDGKLRRENFALCGMTETSLQRILQQSGYRQDDILLLTANRKRTVQCIPKEKRK